MKRCQVKPLSTSAEIHAVLSALKIGERVPPEVYIADYQDGEIPTWVLAERQECSERLIILTVIDQDTYCVTLFGEQSVAVDVFSMPTKTLAGALYMYSPGCVHARNPLCDLRQHARQIADQMNQKT